MFTADGTATIYPKKDVSDVKRNTYTKPTKIESDPKLASSWSEYQGDMNWEAAKAKCASLGMRLPTRADLEAAYRAGVTESWNADGRYYWTSEIDSEVSAYAFSAGTGGVSDNTKSRARSVRCR